MAETAPSPQVLPKAVPVAGAAAITSSGVAVPLQLPAGNFTYNSNPGWEEALPTFFICVTAFALAYMFREPISAFIRNLRTVKTPFVDASTNPQLEEAPPQPPPAIAGQGNDGGANAAANPEIDRLQRENQQLAAIAFYERVYGLIYGTQIVFLLALKLETIDEDNARKFFEASKVQGNTQTFDQWSGFPIEAQLATVTEPGPLAVTYGGGKRRFSISAFGRQFLQYLEDQQRGAQNRPY